VEGPDFVEQRRAKGFVDEGGSQFHEARPRLGGEQEPSVLLGFGVLRCEGAAMG
jgi:hypothetical protein